MFMDIIFNGVMWRIANHMIKIIGKTVIAFLLNLDLYVDNFQ